MHTILIASNHQAWRFHVKQLLIPQGFRICGETQSLDETLLISELNLPHIILFNFKCPLREQLKLIASLSQLGASVKVLVFSPNPIRRSTWSYIRAGACALLQPDTGDDEFISVVHGTLAGFTLTPFNRLTPANSNTVRRKTQAHHAR